MSLAEYAAKLFYVVRKFASAIIYLLHSFCTKKPQKLQKLRKNQIFQGFFDYDINVR